MAENVTLADLHAANKARQTEWCVDGDPEPDLAFRGNELAGETGEACNVIKKLERERHGWRGSRASLDDLAQELADVVICADLCAITAGIDLAAAVIAKFDATSEKQGLTTKLVPAPVQDGASSLGGDGGLERLSAAATPGRWKLSDCARMDNFVWHIFAESRNWTVLAANTMHGCTTSGLDISEEEARANADYVVALVNAHRTGHLVPASLATGGDGVRKTGASASPSGSQASPEAPTDLRPLGVDPSRWELNEETRAYVRDIERAIIRPGDPRLNDPTLIGPAGPAIGLDGYGSQACSLAPASCDEPPQGEDAQAAELRSNASAVGRQSETPEQAPQVDPRKEALAVLEKLCHGRTPQGQIEWLRIIAAEWGITSGRGRDYLDQADRIGTALATLRAEEQDGEVRHD